MPTLPNYSNALEETIEELKTTIKWEQYPKLSEIFEHRPASNIYWKELLALCFDVQVFCLKRNGVI